MLRRTPAVRADDVQATAMALLFEEGLHAIVPERIALRLGVQAAAVQRAQPRFDELVAEVFRLAVAAELAEVKRAMLQHPDPRGQLAALVDLLAEPVQDEITAAWVEGFSFARRNEALAAVIRSEQEAWIRCFVFVIKRGQRDGVFRAEADATAVAVHMLAMIDGLNASVLARFDPGVPRRRMLAGVVERGLGITLTGEPVSS